MNTAWSRIGVTFGYTAVTELQFFGDHRVCRCWRGFRFKHTHCISHNTPTMQRASSTTCNAPTMQRASFSNCSVSFPRRVICVEFFKKIMVEHIIQVTSEYEDRLRRCEYVPRFSCGRRMLKNDGDPIRFFLMYLFCEQSLAIQFLMDIGLLRSKVQCNTCGRDMKWSVDFTHSEGFRWRRSREVQSQTRTTIPATPASRR